MSERAYFKSNCLMEMLKAKAKDWRGVKVVVQRSDRWPCPHFMWHDLRTDEICDFMYDRERLRKAKADGVRIYETPLIYRGYIRRKPWKAYERMVKYR